MTYTVTVRYVRPNTDTDWHRDAADDDEKETWAAYILENYKNTDKLVSRTNHNAGLSEDQNTLTLVTVWKDEDTFDEWVADEKVAAWKAKRKTYQDSVSIEKTIVSKEDT